MDTVLGLVLLLVLWQDGSSDPLTPCPYRCLCFSPEQVLCSDGGMSSLPGNTSWRLKEFIIMSSDLQYLFPHTLAQSHQLTRLVLINNALRSVHARALQHLGALQELEISGNPRLDHLFPETFTTQGNLTKLLLNFNHLAALPPGVFDALRQLDTLQMKGNAISQLTPPLFLQLQRLRVLDLSQNQVRGLERETFSGLGQLEILRMNHNLLRNLTRDAFQNTPRLAELHLEGNKMAELPDGVFLPLTGLKVLSLRGNLLTAFSGDAFGVPAPELRELNLKGNRLAEVSGLGRLASLSSLLLASNRLSALPEHVFRNNSALEVLDLSGNQLRSLPSGVFSGLLGIKTIQLDRNNLSLLEAELFQDQTLIQQLHLSHNQLETLPPGLLEPFSIQHTVWLHGNPWRCDCRLRYLHDWVLRRGPDLELLDRMLCHSPAFLRRRPVAAIGSEQLVCRDQLPDLGRCSQEAHNHTVVLRCRVGGGSPLEVRVRFEERDGNVTEHRVRSAAERSP